MPGAATQLIAVGGAMTRSVDGGDTWRGAFELGSAVSVRDVKVDTSTSRDIVLVPTDDPAAAEIARRARGTPRIANRLLRRVRDYAQVRATGAITLDVALTVDELATAAAEALA